jgi:D-glycero-D-manno-heptose 1,7-bisphosphate phosphatase
MALDHVVFLDRDGVINYDSPDYIKSWQEFQFLPGSLAAMAALTRAGYHLILITNQSIVGRGMVPPSVLEDMHRRLQRAVAAAGGKIFDIFYCPHHPDDNCSCRKPAPGMILAAGKRHGIDLLSAVMIGDNVKDIVCGRDAGCGATILVRTGSGQQAQKELQAKGVETTIADDLNHAARIILSGKLAFSAER